MERCVFVNVTGNRKKALDFIEHMHKVGYYFISDKRTAKTPKEQRETDDAILTLTWRMLPKNSALILCFCFNSITKKHEITITNIKNLRSYPQHKKAKISNIEEVWK